MTEKHHRPPRIATRLLVWFIGGDTGFGALGDLEEQFNETVRTGGVHRARFGYWYQVAAAVPGFMNNCCYWSVVMFKNYLKIALRNIARHKTFSLINVAGLAIGIVCCILILLWVQDELGYDRTYAHSPNLYRIYRQFDTPDGRLISPVNPAGLGQVMKENYTEIVDAVRFMNHNWTVGSDGKRYNELVALADPSIFDMFSLRFISGDREAALSDLRNIVLTEELARKYFGDENPIGKTLQIETWYQANVSGVIENLPEKTTLRPFGAVVNFQIYRSMGRDLADMKIGNYLTYIQLRNDADPETVQGKIEGLLAPYFEYESESLEQAGAESGLGVKVLMHPLLRERLHDIGGGGLITYVYIFTAIGLFILLIACFNYMNLSTAYSGRRAMEIGVRQVVGANRSQLARQFFGEAVLMTVFAVALAVGLINVLLPAFNQMADKQLSMNYSVRMILWIIGIALVTGIVSGAYPALVLSGLEPINVLKGSGKHGSGGSWFRRVLVVTQFAISTFLIVGSIVIFKQLQYIRNTDLGYDTENVINFTLTSELQNQFGAFRSTLLQNPHITGVTRTNAPPVYRESSAGGADVVWEGKTAGDFIGDFGIMGAGPDFAAIFRPEIAEGRFFSEEFPTDLTEGVVLNETAVRAMGLESPIGKRFSVWGFSGKVIGVVRDFHFQSLHNKVSPLAILPRWGIDNICIGISGENTAGTLAFIENTIRTFESGYVLDYRFIDEMIEANYRDEQRVESFIKYGTILAIFISCLGLFGLAAFTAEQRTKEIGIRKVLGSSVAGIIVLLSKEFVKWVLVANIIAWPAAWFAARRWLDGFAYRAPISIGIFAIAGAAALVIAIITVGWQACKAARANPVDSLRYE